MHALTFPALVLGAGFAIDYSRAIQAQTKLDPAVLAALMPAMMQQANPAAQTSSRCANP